MFCCLRRSYKPSPTTREDALSNVSKTEIAIAEYYSQTRLLEDLARAENKTFSELVNEVLNRRKWEMLHDPELLEISLLAKLRVTCYKSA